MLPSKPLLSQTLELLPKPSGNYANAHSPNLQHSQQMKRGNVILRVLRGYKSFKNAMIQRAVRPLPNHA
jgi:hypothetical protein